MNSPDSSQSPQGDQGNPLRQENTTGSFRELFFVSLPLILSAASHSLMNVADRVMLAGYQPDAGSSSEAVTAIDVIAAVTPAGMLFWSVICLPLGVILYANTFVSQFDGANKPQQLVTSFWQAVWLAVFSGLLTTLCIPFSQTLFEFAGHSEAVVQQETAYFNTLCGGGVLLLVSNALGCYFSGRRKTAIVMCVNLVGVTVNVIVDYGLIFGHWGLPELGITGAALATITGRLCEIVIYSVLIWWDRHRYHILQSPWLNVSFLRQYIKYGLPSGLHYFVDHSGFLVFLFIVGSLSRDAMAATNLAFSINSLIFVPLMGFGTAVQTLIGHHIGAGMQDAASRTTWNAIRMGVVWTGTTALLLLLFPEAALKPFLYFEQNGDAEATSIRTVIPVAASLLKFVAIYSVFDATAVVFSAALRGAGDTLFPMVITLFSSWLVMTLPAWLIVRFATATVDLLWMTCTAHVIFMGTAMLLRFVSGKWKQITLVDESV